MVPNGEQQIELMAVSGKIQVGARDNPSWDGAMKCKAIVAMAGVEGGDADPTIAKREQIRRTVRLYSEEPTTP